MTYRAKQAARMRRRVPRWLRAEWRRRNPFTLASAQAILKQRYGDSPTLWWRVAYYGFAPTFFHGRTPGKGAAGALDACRVPVTLTSLADFEAALYWYHRKLGPDPGDYVVARHAREPYR